MDRYPNLRAKIKQEFGSIYQFCRETKLPPATVKHLILGNLGDRAEAKAKGLIEKAFEGRLGPGPTTDRCPPSAVIGHLPGLWIRQDPKEMNNLVLEVPPGTKMVRINWTVSITFE